MKTMKLLAVFFVLWNTALAREGQGPAPESLNIPESVSRVFAAKGLDKQYEISFHLNPFYLRGDFNGDGKPDIAVLVKQKKTKKIGIAIIHSGTDQVFFAGAGTEMGNGGDNFDWMDTWNVYDKSEARRAGEAADVHLIGEALYVAKSESTGGLIYWNGRKYAWRQHGD